MGTWLDATAGPSQDSPRRDVRDADNGCEAKLFFLSLLGSPSFLEADAKKSDFGALG